MSCEATGCHIVAPMAELIPGAYDATLTTAFERQIAELPSGLQAAVRTCAPEELAGRLADLLHSELSDALAAMAAGERGAVEAIEVINRLMAALREGAGTARESVITSPVRILESIHDHARAPELPQTGLIQPWLFTAGRREPSLLGELRRELLSADQADILVSFITRSGVRRLLDVLQAATAVRADGQPRLRLRIITTTYTGATDAEAVEELARLPGAEVRISLDGSRTRLHAKSWILHRATGSGSAYIGSANLSAAALMGGIEWTVKVPEVGQPALFARAAAEFACLWADPEFQHYRSGDKQAAQALREALRRERGETSADNGSAAILAFDWVPRPFQRLMLERLDHERLQGRRRNLVVAATGTGKTVVAALDYRRTCERHGGSPPTVLFIAHRVEILERALGTFRSVLRPLGITGFAELLSGHHRPERLDHVFATIDSVLSQGLLATPERWHTVILDECHRMGAETRFDEVAATLRPSVLVGLTATPERADGHSILPHFDNRPDGSPAVELRLWDALDQQLVVPFEYYACDDETDFRGIPWGQPGERAELERVIDLAAESRALQVISAWRAKVGNPAGCRAIAFCVSVAHAEYMANAFVQAGIPARSVHGQTPIDVRRDAPGLLARGEVSVLTTVDLYNEGIDIPCIDTLLFLRPTQSPVVFQQQLGRGLRHHEHANRRKESCLVLDFVGRHRTDFRYDRLLSPVTGLGRKELLHAVEAGFTSLPPGCHIHLEPQARSQVLASLREALQQNWRKLQRELLGYVATKGQAEARMVAFLSDQQIDVEDLYPDRRDGSGWTALRRACGLSTAPVGPGDDDIGRRLGRLLHIDDPDRIGFVQRVAESGCAYQALNEQDRVRLRMLAFQLDERPNRSCQDLVHLMETSPAIRSELSELAGVLGQRSDLPQLPIPGFETVPLCLHAAYERREILAGLGRWTDDRRPLSNTGVERNQQEQWEAFFVTLDKTEGFHGRIAYHDCAVAPDRFQWQTQSGTTPTSTVGQRYLAFPGNGWRFLLFVQERKGMPFRALGPLARCLSHHGTKPMTIMWELQVPIPQELFLRYSPTR